MNKRLIASGFVTVMLISVLCSACASKNKAETSENHEYSESETEAETRARSQSGKTDSDSDGISDDDEIMYLETDPHNADTDGDGIDDYHDDADSDGVIDGEEAKLGTYAWTDDSDFDGVSDYDEIYVYHTDPCEEDADRDGADDLYEIEHDMNPLVADTFYVLEKSTGSIGAGTMVAASVKMEVKNGLTDSFEIDEVDSFDDPYSLPFWMGYIGPGCCISVEGEFDKAELTFLYDASRRKLSDKFVPRIYYLNRKTKSFEEVPDQVVEEGKVTVEITQLSTYVLLNKVGYDKAMNEQY
ncbi:MAG: hypothetical protein K6F17_00575 [Lachnospiraceae bacterium]|nr:hypothetical protein [Lachnospiraceae bacterium]